MRHPLLLLLGATLLAATSLAAQGGVPSLPPIPDVRPYTHWGTIENSYDDEENSTSIALDLPFGDEDLHRFVRRGRVRHLSFGAGFVYPGKVMTKYPDVVTLILKLTRDPSEALKSDKLPTELVLMLDGAPLRVGSTLVARNAISEDRGAMREIEDTYVVVLTLGQFLRIVNAAKVSAALQGQAFEFTGGPLEGMRDLASRIIVTP
ncbi:MAG TPA: hypothetical protein VHM67_16485 [Gemmatimonadaceae bacterium]|nr:hypothetical protein [Gemmatimonadaceae bacterium]